MLQLLKAKMTSSYQEPELFQEIQNREESGFDSATVHRLNSTSAAATTSITTCTVEKCTTCGSIKRRSPSSFSSFQEPSPKRATLYPPLSTTTTSPPLLPPPPPSSSNANHSSNLHRSLSDITALTQLMNAHSPECSAKTNADISVSASPSPGAVAASLALPTLPPPVTVCRSLSDPISSDYQPRTQSARTLLRSQNSDHESHESKSLKRIKQKLKEMSQWVEKVMSEEDEEDTYFQEDKCKVDYKQNGSANGADAQGEEAVWVEERNGEGLVLHFKCPCSKGYEIFLSGNNCYYRLM